VFAQLAELLERDRRNARLQVKQSEIFAVLLFEHLKKIRLMLIASPVAVLVEHE
jgi:hypothetical protein